ncbi:MAG: hypothetical protein IPM64_08205 [Phycisphaerales bacterium]|nr:hypothetical protein [Phycisphaerales bacterium]
MTRFWSRYALLGALLLPLPAITISCQGLSDFFDNISDALDDDDDFFDELEDLFD